MRTKIANNFSRNMFSVLLIAALSTNSCQQAAAPEDPQALADAFSKAFYQSFNQTRDFRNASTQEEIDAIQAGHDAANTAMRETLKQYLLLAGWPEPGVFGNINLKEYIRHTPEDFLNDVLPILKAQVLAGQMPAQTYANIVDGRALNRGGLQPYGSIVNKDRDGNPVLPYVLDIEQTNALRKEIGLPELEAYLLFK
jgi:hypothetical protein